MLLCPLSWSHVFVPVLPHTLIDTVQCPTPFLMGIHSSEYTDDLPIVGDMCVCNLDTSTISDVAGATDEHLHPGQRGDGEAGGEGKRGGGGGSDEPPRMPAMPDALRVGLLSRLQQALRVRGVNNVLCMIDYAAAGCAHDDDASVIMMPGGVTCRPQVRFYSKTARVASVIHIFEYVF